MNPTETPWCRNRRRQTAAAYHSTHRAEERPALLRTIIAAPASEFIATDNHGMDA
jgi:hypothetical protein